jgi:hypothetical protein
MRVQHEMPDYEPPGAEVVDATLQAIDVLLNDCGSSAVDNTCAALIHFVQARWDAIRAEREVHGELWCQERCRDTRRTPCETHSSAL